MLRKLALGCGGLLAVAFVILFIAFMVDTGGDSLPAEQAVATFTPTPGAVAADTQPEATEPEPPVELVPTPEPAPTNTSVPPIELAGTASQITADFTTHAPIMVAEYTNSGDGHFAVWLKNAQTAENEELLANLIGPATGAGLLPVSPGDYFYEVEGNGSWSVSTKDLGHWARASGPPPYSFTGTFADVTPVFALDSGRVNFRVTHQGSGHMAATMYDAQDGSRVGLLANEIGAFDVSTALGADAGLYVIHIEAEGGWTIQVDQN